MEYRLTEVLKKYWGYDSFRPLQEDIIKSVLAGKDTLGLMPTGGGKSITFQVPGMILDGITLVITPLVSLMKDQVDNLYNRGIRAVYFHAGMTAREMNLGWEKLHNAKVKFLYISPERLSNERFCSGIKHLKISLLVVDEAHCISQWGYDFRPSYLQISKIRKTLLGVPILALTATATIATINDICEKLNFKNHNIFKKSFSRPNIGYVSREVDDKYSQIVHILRRVLGTAIIYVRSRKRTREIAEYLQSNGISAVAYHAGLSFEDKSERQNKWKTGEIRVMVATNAFGMGIDKPDVRVVVHHDIPSSLEEYYQEAGRAGRDGLKSYAVVLYEEKDKSLLRRRVTEAFPARETVLKIYELACVFLNVAVGEGYNKIYEFNIEKFCEIFKLSSRIASGALKILSGAGWIEYIEETETRSRLMIICDREELYYSKISSQADKVLQMILRIYPGLFADYVFINEVEIASKSQLSEQQVYESLIELSSSHILHYIPRKRTPYIFFPTSREETKYITIPKSVYEDRKNIMKNRVEAMIDYVYDSHSCRVRRMLAYFGEIDNSDCQTCDVCLKANKTRLKDSNLTNLLNQVLECLKASDYGMTLAQLQARFHPYEKQVNEIVGFLCDENYVTSSNGIFMVKQ